MSRNSIEFKQHTDGDSMYITFDETTEDVVIKIQHIKTGPDGEKIYSYSEVNLSPVQFDFTRNTLKRIYAINNME